METIGAPVGPLAGLVAFVASAVVNLVFFRRLRLAVAALTGLGVAIALPAVESLQTSRVQAARSRHIERLAPGQPRARGQWSVGAPPDLRRLERVIPIGQTRAIGGTEVTLLSLEVYAEGFLLNSRVSGDLLPEHRSGLTNLPNLVPTASDDRGRRYVGWPTSGSSNGGGWRAIHHFGPSLDPTASELRLEVEEIDWEQLGPGREHSVRVEPGPWSFAVPL